MKWNETQLEVDDLSSEERKLNFKLTDKKARANLLKSAGRKHLEIETKQNCTNLRFSPGAFLLVGKKLVEECENIHKKGNQLVHDNVSITVDEFRTGVELNNKHFDNKIVFSVDGHKVVVHCYNSTQNLKVEGRSYLLFIDKFLRPLLESQIEEQRDNIEAYDSNIKVALGSKHLRRKSVRISAIKGSSYYLKGLTCKSCDVSFKSVTDLNKHKKMEHNATLNSSQESEF